MSLLLSLEELNADDFIVERLVTLIHINDVELTIKEVVSYITFLVSDSNYIDYIDTQGVFLSHNPLNLPIPIRSLYNYKYTTISRMKKHLRNTCSYLFSDILYKMSYALYHPLQVPGFQDPTFGPINFEQTWTWHAHDLVDEDDRSLYVTFSRGLYVSEQEVKRVLTTNYGDCVQFVDMPSSSSNQVLFARVVLKNVEFIDMILSGRSVAKFMFKGKHVWAKKYRPPRIRI
ncbi:hypothetical protein vseg_002543 [Gypsophila vaccaria]